MTRNEFSTAVAAAITEVTGFPVTANHVEPIALALWDAAQGAARTEPEFRAMVMSGTATLARELVAMAPR